MATPEQRVGFKPGPGCSNVIEAVIEKIQKIKLVKPKNLQQWPTRRQPRGSGDPELDSRLTDLFQDTLL